MGKLYKTTSENAELLIEKLEVATSFWSRAVGLLGRKELPQHHAMWFPNSNNIHTHFMRFAIDCIFLDKNMEIKKIVSAVKPFRFVGPYWKTSSVIEANAGFADAKNLKIGDHLYVVN